MAPHRIAASWALTAGLLCASVNQAACQYEPRRPLTSLHGARSCRILPHVYWCVRVLRGAVAYTKSVRLLLSLRCKRYRAFLQKKEKEKSACKRLYILYLQYKKMRQSCLFDMTWKSCKIVKISHLSPCLNAEYIIPTNHPKSWIWSKFTKSYWLVCTVTTCWWESLGEKSFSLRSRVG